MEDINPAVWGDLVLQINNSRHNTTAHSLLKRAWKSIRENYDGTTDELAFEFIKAVLEEEEKIIEADLRNKRWELKELSNELEKAKELIKKSKKADNDLRSISNDIEEEHAYLEALREESAELSELKSSDKRLYNATLAYKFAYSRCGDEATALKSFNSYLIGNKSDDSDDSVEEYTICSAETKRPTKRW